MSNGNAVDLAKRVLAENEAVLYGIFGVIAGSGSFPPRSVLNEFLLVGNDPCDQDGRMQSWRPFALTGDEYREVLEWWTAGHPGDVENSLGVSRWDDWVQEMLDRT